MPGSNDYSMDPELTGTGSSNSAQSTSGSAVPGITPAQPVTKPKPSPLYQQKDFRTEKLASLQGMMSDKRANRLVNRYMKSAEGQKAEEAFVRAEIDKSRAALDAYLQEGKDRRAQMSQEALRSINESLARRTPIQDPVPSPAPALASRSARQTPATDWLAEAKKYGFNSLDEVRNWQSANGLVVDGKFGNNSKAVWNRLHNSGGTPQGGAQNQTVGQSTAAIPDWRKAAIHAGVILKPGATPEEDTAAIRAWQKQHNIAETGVFDEASVNAFRSIIAARSQQGNAGQTGTAAGGTVAVAAAQRQQPRTTGTWAPKYWRSHHNGIKSVRIDGVEYPVMVSTGILAYEGGLGIENDHSYALDPNTGKVRKLTEYGTGNINGTWADGSTWVDQSNLNTLAKLGSSSEYQRAGIFRKEQMRRNAGLSFKQGGTMNRINYFQQGGAAPQQDIKAKVVALVQAAVIDKDQKAAQQLQQIMEAAKAGDQQAVQLAQLIEQVVKEMQGQATAAKWGAKLNYIQSLKFAKGGKTCPACEKKVEMKACGGKKAKKRYFGGII